MLRLQPIDRPLFGALLLLALSFSGFVVALASQTSPQNFVEEHQTKPADTEGGASNNQPGSDHVPFVVKIQEAPKSQRDADEARRDRKKKATYERDAWRLSWITALVGVFTLFAIVIQAYFLWRTIKVSETAARAAKDAAEAIPTVERAYLFIGGKDIRLGTEGITCGLQVENCGKTPAILKQVYGEFSEAEPITAVPIYRHGSAKTYDGIVSQDAEIILPLRFSSPLVQDHYFFGYAVYLDIFRREHTSRFCIKMFIESNKFEVCGPPAWNEWT